MKVLHIGKYFSPFKGGVETYLLDAMNALSRRGVACAALVHDHQRSWRGQTEPHGTDGARFEVRRAATWFSMFFTPFSPGFRGDLARLLKNFRPDIVHVHLPNPSAVWLLTLRQARSVPLVVHWHSDVITSAQGPLMKALYALYRPLERRLLRSAAAVIATSRSYLETSESLQAFPEKCHVVPLGLDVSRFEALEALRRPEQLRDRHLNVLAVGRLTYYKGFGYLVRALAEAPDVHAHIVGRGELRRELGALARHMGVAERVTFHGAVDDAGLAALLAHCDCLCLPSVERTEAFGLVLLEAMYFGRATVSSAVTGSGMDWVVEDGVTGLKVRPGDARALAAALVRLRDDSTLADQLGRGGRARFDTTFTIDRSIDALLNVYREVAA